MTKLLALALVVAAACGGGQKREPPPGGAGSGDAAGSGATGAAPPPVSRAECEAMYDHVVDVGLAAQKQQKPPEEWPTAEQVAAIKAKGHADDAAMQKCEAFDRPTLDCVMAAATADAMNACLGAE